MKPVDPPSPQPQVDEATQRLEQDLRDSKALLENAFARSPLMMGITEFDSGKYLDVNETFCRLLGFTREELLGRNGVDLGIIGAEQRTALSEQMRRDRHLSGYEIALRGKDGRRVLFRLWTELIETSQGLRLFSAGEDVTDRRRVEDERAEALSRLQKITSRVPGMVYQYRQRPDGSASYPFTSAGVKDLLGVTDEELLRDAGAAWRRVHPDDLQAMVSAVQSSARDLTPVRTEFRLQWPDGTLKWVLASSIPEREADGSILWHGFAADVTERREMEAAVAQNDRLASMGLLAAGVAHEINNPLAAVLSNLDALTQDLPRVLELTRRCLSAVRSRLGEEALAELLGAEGEAASSANLDDLATSAQAALDGTRRIRKLSRGLGTFAGADRTDLAAVDVNTAVDAATTMAQHELKFRATLHKELGPVGPVLASESKLAQVFLNLLINAALAVPEGHVERNKITVRTWQEGSSVFVEVADTGHGLTQEDLHRLFEPFFTTRGRGLGLGLGLAISRNIVGGFGGELNAESEVGRGTRVTVRLPAHRPVVAAAAPSSPSATPVATRGRVLVIDDEPAIRRTLVRILGRDHDVVSVESGLQAQALLATDDDFDLILCDLMMPKMTGMELHAWMVEKHPALADEVVFISGGAFTPTASAYLEGVKNPRLEKPFDQQALRALVSRRVASRRTPRAHAR